MPVRPAITPADHQACKHLIIGYAKEFEQELGAQDLFEEVHFLAELYGPPGALLVLEDEGEIRGCVAFEVTDAGARMKRLIVDPRHRGKGYGRELATSIVAVAREGGHRRMVLDTAPEMGAAQALYRSMGFDEVVPDWESPCASPVYMAMEL